MHKKLPSFILILLLATISLLGLTLNEASAKTLSKPSTPPEITCHDGFSAGFTGPDGVEIASVDNNWETFSGYPAVYDSDRMKMYTLASNPNASFGTTLGPVLTGDFDMRTTVAIPRNQLSNPDMSYGATFGLWHITLFGASLTLKEDDNTNSKVHMRLSHTGGDIYNATANIVNTRTANSIDLRLVKSGDTFTGYYRNRSELAEWVEIGSAQYPFEFGGNVYTGFSATNRQSGAAVDANAWLDNVSVVCPTPLQKATLFSKDVL